MFPVKGLSISAEKLKIETENADAGAASTPKLSRKRKRQGNADNVTAANLADLWEKVIEHKTSPGPAGKTQDKQDSKRQKKERESAAADNAARKASTAQVGSRGQQTQSGDNPERKEKKKDKEKGKDMRGPLKAPTESTEQERDEWDGIDDDHEPANSAETLQSGKADKKQKKGDKRGQHRDKTPKAEPGALPPAPPAPTTAKLTPLQASMREKLISARFRHLNEALYTRPSAEAFRLFQDSPEMFAEYHEGFRRQVGVWPENPVDGYIADIKARAKVRFPPRLRGGHQPVTPSQLPLPRPAGSKTCAIADLGCGDAKLAAALQPFQAKLHLSIHSFDLQTGGSPLVTRADVANLPLADASVDVAIFCLALMGTNWTDFIEEAYRVLRWKGELWVAEIKSRFANPAKAKNKSKAAGAAVAHSVGKRKKGVAGGPGGRGGNDDDETDEAADLAELAAHVDGDTNQQQQQQQQETDISAFVEALHKRGFLLNRDLGQNAVDVRNKMFVRMYFVKAAPAVRGKCAAPSAAVPDGAGPGSTAQRAQRRLGGKPAAPPKKAKKFIDDGRDEAEEENEAAVLKPCVYKIR